MEKPHQKVPLTKPAVAARNPEKPITDAEVRASDADRDRVADILREALAQGRLDAEEHAERIDGVYTAKTVGELERFVRDLPEGRRPAPPRAPHRPMAPPPHSAPGRMVENLVAIFSSAVRRGRWRVGYRTTAFALFGSVEIDLTEALFERPEVTISATSIFGSVEIRVPENISLRGTGTGILGSYEVETVEAADANAPVVVVTGLALLGSVEAKPKRGAWLKDLRHRSHRRHQDR